MILGITSTVIIGALIVYAAILGGKKGILGIGRILTGILLGILIVPHVAPTFEKLLWNKVLSDYYKFDNHWLEVFFHYALKFFVMVAVVLLVMVLVDTLLRFRLPGFLKLIDHILGAGIGVLAVCTFVWGVDWILRILPLGIINQVATKLDVSFIYRWISQFEVMFKFFA